MSTFYLKKGERIYAFPKPADKERGQINQIPGSLVTDSGEQAFALHNGMNTMLEADFEPVDGEEALGVVLTNMGMMPLSDANIEASKSYW